MNEARQSLLVCVFMTGKSERRARGIHKKCRLHFPEFVKRTQDFTGDMVLIARARETSSGLFVKFTSICLHHRENQT